jgi:Tol biopolymer transport system component
LTFSGNHGDPVWSPDGTKIAFSRGTPGNKQIYIMPANNPTAAQLLPTVPGENENLSWVRKP